MRVPRRGEIWHLDLEPTRGQEQRGQRYVFIVSPAAFNRSGLETQGVVQCSQIRTLDWRARQARHRETAPAFVTEQVLARIHPLVT